MSVLLRLVSLSTRDFLFWEFLTLVHHPCRVVGVRAVCYLNDDSLVQIVFLPLWFRLQLGTSLDISSTPERKQSPPKERKQSSLKHSIAHLVQMQASHAHPRTTPLAFPSSQPLGTMSRQLLLLLEDGVVVLPTRLFT